jgi:tetratricopeptide (TPR) repeat protein
MSNEKAVEEIERMLDTDEFGEDVRVNLLLRISELTFEVRMWDKANDYTQLILSDKTATPVQRGAAMMRQAQILHEEGNNEAAVERARDAVKEWDRVDGQGMAWHMTNSLKWAGGLAREQLLDYETANFFFEKMIEYNTGPYWEMPARLEIAQTYRVQNRFNQAEEQYQKILETEGQSHRALMARAEMVFYDMDREERGLELLQEAFNNTRIHHTMRYRGVFKLADHFKKQREYDRALEWLSKVPDLPMGNKEISTRYTAQAYYEMGKVHQASKDIEQAKAMFRKAINLEGGDMRYRVMARDEIEDIRYFE